MAKIKDELMNHDYDGIQEYDNDLPGWWKYLFYFTIIFAFVYLMYYHVLGIGDSSRVEYQKETGTYVASNAERGPLTVYQSPYRGEAESGDVVDQDRGGRQQRGRGAISCDFRGSAERSHGQGGCGRSGQVGSSLSRALRKLRFQ